MSVEANFSGHRRIITELIESYRKEPCLWLTRCREYRDKELKNAAYDRLVSKLKEIDPTADKSKVIRKINSLRTNRRKEKIKIMTASPERAYKPRLWYYDLFYFLDDYNHLKRNAYGSKRDKLENFECADPSVLENLHNEEPAQLIEEYHMSVPSSVTHKSHSTFQIISDQEFAEDIIDFIPNVGESMLSNVKDAENEELSCDSFVSQSAERCNIQNDRYDNFGQIVAIKLRNIKNRGQRLLAEKLINDALFMAEFGQLKVTHAVTAFDAMYFPLQNDNANNFIEKCKQIN